MKRYIRSNIDDSIFNENPDERAKLAQRTSDPELLDIYRYDPDIEVRRSVMENPNIDESTIADMVREYVIDDFEDEHDYTLWSAATNPKCPVDVFLDRYKQDPENAHIREALAHHPNAPVELLREFADDENYDVRIDVAENPSTPQDILIMLSESTDYDGYIHSAISRNPSTPVDVLVRMSKSRNPDLRLGVAKNPSTPLDIVAQLVNDSTKYVSNVAKEALARRQ